MCFFKGLGGGGAHEVDNDGHYFPDLQLISIFSIASGKNRREATAKVFSNLLKMFKSWIYIIKLG